MEHTIPINVGNGYKVIIGEGILASCGERLQSTGIHGKLTVVTDSNVAKLHLDTVLNSLRSTGFDAKAYIFPAGEGSKTIQTLEGILEFFAACGLDRGDCAVALGGGVTGDITGFAAGCYMRGIAYVQLPTTLLAAVDSSVGGKTAIDLKAGKNLAGLFIQPRAVLCDPLALQTLPHEVLIDGAAEAIKAGILGDDSLFLSFLDGSWKTQLPEVIARCVQFKGRVVEADEHELGERKLLNLGHTPAHAIEVLSGFTIPHGHTVAIGTAMMARAAHKRGSLERAHALAIQTAIARCGLPVRSPFTPDALAEASLADKKRHGDAITVILPRRIGYCVMEQIPVTALQALYADGMEVLV